MLSRPIVDRLPLNPRLQPEGRLSVRAAIVVASLATLVLWLGLTEALVGWM